MRCQWYLKNFNKVWAPPCGFYIHTKNRAVGCVWRTKPRINYIQGGGVKQNINMETHYFHSFRNDMFFSVSFFITFATTISKSSSVTSTLLSLRANIPDSVHTACSKQNKCHEGRRDNMIMHRENTQSFTSEDFNSPVQ